MAFASIVARSLRAMPHLVIAVCGVLLTFSHATVADVKPSAKPKRVSLSSVYVNLSKCKNLWQAPADLPEGSDEPIECVGPNGYKVHEHYSAVTTVHSVSYPTRDFSVTIGSTDGQGWSAAPLMEFRLCNGRPFAVIQRIGLCDAKDSFETCDDGRSLHYVLVVEGLIGLVGRHSEITAGRGDNKRARQAADAWIGENGCPAPPE